MRPGKRPVHLALFVISLLMVGPGLAPAQVDLAKALVGRWEGEIALALAGRTANPGLVLVITSVKEDGGRWAADARAGTKTGGLGPVKIEIDHSGTRPSLRWTGGSGIVYNVHLVDGKTLSGTATLTAVMAAGARERERPVKLEKVN